LPKPKAKSRFGLRSKIDFAIGEIKTEKKMEIHVKRHILIKDFAWRVLSKLLHFDNCKMAFVTKHELNIHLNYNTGKRPYACRIDGCKKAFPDPNIRQSHDCRRQTCFGLRPNHERKVNHFKKDDDNNNNSNDQQKSIMGS
jgi:hypothetical protein